MSDGHSHGGGQGHGHSHGGGACGGDSSVVLERSDSQSAAWSGASNAAPLPRSAPAADATLEGEWARAEILYARVDAGHVDEAPLALAAFIRAAEVERRESVFSVGETVDDHPTASLKYLLGDYYVGSLLAREMPGESRAPALRRARAYMQRFIERTLSLHALPGGEDWRKEAGIGMRQESIDTALSDDEEEKEARRGVSSGGDSASTLALRRRAQLLQVNGGSGGGIDAGAARVAKIERFRRAQVCRKRLAVLAEERTRAAARLARSGGTDTAADGVGGGQTAAGGGVDDATEREWILLSIEAAARAAIDDLASFRAEAPLLALAAEARERELEILMREGGGGSASAAHIAMTQADSRAKARAGGSAGSGGPPPGDLSIDPRRPGLSITTIDPSFEIKSETVRASIFRSGHNAPTMGLEEWGAVVMDKTRDREAREKIQGERRVKTMEELIAEGIEDDEDLFDLATMRKRGFEDW